MGEALDLLLRVREGFAVEAAFDDTLQAADVADAFVATLAPLVAEDFVCVMDGGALTTEYRGLEGLRDGWADFLGAFETISITPEEVRENEDGTVVAEFVRLVGRPVGADGEIEQEGGAVWRVRDGRLSAVEYHLDRAAILRSAGLAQRPPERDGKPQRD
jgi:ketosteroid isomerase-like protein